MDNINKTFAELELSPVDTAFLDNMFPKLVGYGLNPVRTLNGTLCVELKAFGAAYAVAHIVSAREVFYTDEHVALDSGRPDNLCKKLLHKLHGKQRLWVEHDDASHKHLERLIFIVDADGISFDEKFAVLRMTIENDMYAAKKTLCTWGTLRDAMASPFRPVAHRAHDRPSVYCTRSSVHEFDPKPKADYATTVTAAFKPANFSSMQEEIATRANRNAVRAVAGKVFRRIMGTDYLVVEGDEWPEVSRSGPDGGMPYFMLSNGEKMVLAFALFLALAHDQVEEGMCIGVCGSLNALDTMRQLHAYDCLFHFMVATGASVYFRSDNSDCQVLAERKLVLAQTLVRHAIEFQAA